jgi:fluoroquinolone transport system permease protein
MLLKLTKYDILFQLKQGFYTVYAILVTIYILLLFYLPQSVRMDVTAYILLSDTSVMGLTFVGALVLLEKQQSILQTLFITPLKLSTYLWGKSNIAHHPGITDQFAYRLPSGGMLPNPVAMLSAVILSSIFFTFIGLGIAARVNTLNEYLSGIMLGGLITVAPVALYFFIPDISVIFPVNAAVDLLLTPPEEQIVKGIIADTAVLILWSILAYLWAKKQFLKYIIEK